MEKLIVCGFCSDGVRYDLSHDPVGYHFSVLISGVQFENFFIIK